MDILHKAREKQTIGSSVLCLTGLAVFGLGKALAAEQETTAANHTPSRIVAVGDLHADIDHALQTLQMAGIVDGDGHWMAGDSILVQTGDITDRGPDSLEVITLLRRLQTEAKDANGAVYPLLGNHEAMNLLGDWRYVSEADVADFGSVEARQAAFSLDGELGSWLSQLDAVKQIDGTVFLHGGVAPTWSQFTAEELSQQVRTAIINYPSGKNASGSILGSDGPLWFRGYLTGDPNAVCGPLQLVLAQMGAHRMVVGHTTQRSGEVAVRCNGALLGIDTGISAHYGGHHSAVEIKNGDAQAIYSSGRKDLPDPAKQLTQ